jgi:signal transduction histidine kinase
MAERLEERERIARELHDTLLQSVQALTLRFQLAADDLPPAEPARRSLEGAIDLADRVVAEGRDRVRDLRSVRDEGDIRKIIGDIVGRQEFGPEVEIVIETSGAPRTLDPMVLDEAGRIAGEAVFNSWRHARATRLHIEIGFQASFSLRIADNGVGIDADAAGKDGHFGLSGMRERAPSCAASWRYGGSPRAAPKCCLPYPARSRTDGMRDCSAA